MHRRDPRLISIGMDKTISEPLKTFKSLLFNE